MSAEIASAFIVFIFLLLLQGNKLEAQTKNSVLRCSNSLVSVLTFVKVYKDSIKIHKKIS